MDNDSDELVTEEPPSYATIAREMYGDFAAWTNTATPWMALTTLMTMMTAVMYVQSGLRAAAPVGAYTLLTYYLLATSWGNYNVE